ncbi:hypothetical protein MmTuc01_2624 [Methanosarcina mazei Tuc01]|uniref:Uncharacterized protein n=1 Tax=Methanosarcina mazei Tuc01 TaxID=1236903 RepID=M1PBL0_METMZ|nr:hypothetical protein MmTuc01_2624 [Methanosarcina mazei Tuc01]
MYAEYFSIIFNYAGKTYKDSCTVSKKIKGKELESKVE